MPHPDLSTRVPSRLQLAPGAWPSLLEGLSARFPNVSTEQWRGRFARGLVQDANGRPLRADGAWRVGQEIVYFREVAAEAPIPFAERVLYQDAHLLVADKPHFLPVVPSGRFVRQTLLARLRERDHCQDLVPLHRLDRATAGLVLFSVNRQSRGVYQALFREHRIVKRYQALAPPLEGLQFPLLRRSRLERGTPFFRTQEVAGEPNSSTRIQVLNRGPREWRYALQPMTGRKHQLRVHMAALGAPIRNDPLYPEVRFPVEGREFAAPLALLACSLSFEDPIDGAARHFQSDFVLPATSSDLLISP